MLLGPLWLALERIAPEETEAVEAEEVIADLAEPASNVSSS
jgi:hypothetical protein